MRVCLLCPRPNVWAAIWERELLARGHQVDWVTALPASWLQTGPPDYDLCLPLVMDRDVRAAHKGRLAAAQVLEALEVPLVNSCAAIVRSADKRAAHACWARAGLPQPRSWLLHGLQELPVPVPLVLKSCIAWGGRDICRVGSLQEAQRQAAGWVAPALLQEEIVGAVCVRVIATPAQVLYAAEKHAPPGQLVASVGRGARREEIQPDAELAALACRMVALLGGGLMGVDILRDAHGGLWALEANAPFAFPQDHPQLHRRLVAAVAAVA